MFPCPFPGPSLPSHVSEPRFRSRAGASGAALAWPQRRLWGLTCLRRGGVGLASGALREDLHGDGLHGLGGARVAEHVDVIAALVDEALARVVGLARAAGLIAAVVGDR